MDLELQRQERLRNIQQEWEEAEAGRRRVEQEWQKAYDRPLPAFKPQMSLVVRHQLLGYIERVVNDAAKKIAEGVHHQFLSRPLRVGERVEWDVVHYIPIDRIKIALRVSKLIGSEINALVFICITDNQYVCLNEGFWERILFRLHNNKDREGQSNPGGKTNLVKNVPFLESLAAQRLEVCQWRGDNFDALLKSGFLYTGEEKVVHLEIFSSAV